MISRAQVAKFTALIPLLGIIFMLGNSHLKYVTGIKYRVKITGYDPRDLIYGHYLSYRFQLMRTIHEHRHTKPEEMGYCLVKKTPDHEVSYTLSPDHKDSKATCTSWIPHHLIHKQQKYLIPEAEAPQLENALRKQDITVDLIVQSNGKFTVGELYIDGKPWRDVIK